MEFDKSKVYTALNADELKIGSKVIGANDIDSLKDKVRDGEDYEIVEVKKILDESNERRFQLDRRGVYPFVYFISEPIEKKWIVYLCRTESGNPYLTACESDRWEFAKEKYSAKTKLFEGTEDEIVKWYFPRKKFADVIAAWEDGKVIQFLDSIVGKWYDIEEPEWSIDTQYRIKPKCLKWTDLKLGDVIRRKDGLIEILVTVIDKKEYTPTHIFAGSWLNNRDLEDWEKVDDYWETVNEKD